MARGTSFEKSLAEASIGTIWSAVYTCTISVGTSNAIGLLLPPLLVSTDGTPALAKALVLEEVAR